MRNLPSILVVCCLLSFAVVNFVTCKNNKSIAQSESETLYPEETGDSAQLKLRSTLDPFAHFELLSSRGEDELGAESYVYVLPVDFRSNGYVAETIAENIQHSMDICAGGTDTNHIDYPYVRYKQFDSTPKRGNTWVFISQRLIPTQTTSVKAWMDSVALLFPGGIADPVSSHPLTIYKKKWAVHVN